MSTMSLLVRQNSADFMQMVGQNEVRYCEKNFLLDHISAKEPRCGRFENVAVEFWNSYFRQSKVDKPDLLPCA